MKFFKCHSQKMKNDKVICLQDKFTDIGPDVFSGFAAEYIILADTTKTVRSYAFSGLGKCSIYLPEAIEEIEPLAFENIASDTTFFCKKGSCAERVCIEHGMTVSYDISKIFSLAEEQRKLVEEQKQLVCEQQRLVEEHKRLIEEQKRMLEEQNRKEEEKRAESHAEEEQRKKPESEALSKSDETVKLFVYDEENGEKIKSVKSAEFPEKGKSHIVNGEVYIVKTMVNGKTKSRFVSKIEYDQIKTGEAKKTAGGADICLFCGKSLLKSDRFCQYCGKKVKNIKICSRCGEPNEADDNFCSNCGLKI